MNLGPWAIGLFLKHWKWLSLALAFGALFAHDRRVDHLRAHYKAQWAAEKSAHDETIVGYRNAQIAAQAVFDAKIQAIQLKNKEANDEADKRVADLRADYAERVRRLPRAAACPAGRPGMPETGVSESPDRPGEDTLVSIERTDALICAENTARLQSAHQWALGGTE